MYLLAIGDSKTVGYFCCVATNGYRDELLTNLQSEVGPEFDSVYYMSSAYAFPHTSTVEVAGYIDDFLAALVEEEKIPNWVLLNLGSNDFANVRLGVTTQAVYEASLSYILDAIHSKYPTAQIRLMRPIWVGEEIGSSAINDTWMPNVIASRTAWAAVGPDERVFLAPAETRTDVTHPSVLGYSLTAAEWQTAMGY